MRDTVKGAANANNDTVTGLKKSLQKVYTIILNNPDLFQQQSNHIPQIHILIQRDVL